MKSVEPAARRTLLGCQSTAVTVLLIGRLMCFATHLQDVTYFKTLIFGILPVIVLLKVADRDDPSSGPDCKLVLARSPTDTSCCSVDPGNILLKSCQYFVKSPGGSPTQVAAPFITVLFTYSNPPVYGFLDQKRHFWPQNRSLGSIRAQRKAS